MPDTVKLSISQTFYTLLCNDKPQNIPPQYSKVFPTMWPANHSCLRNRGLTGYSDWQRWAICIWNKVKFKSVIWKVSCHTFQSFDRLLLAVKKCSLTLFDIFLLLQLIVPCRIKKRGRAGGIKDMVHSLTHSLFIYLPHNDKPVPQFLVMSTKTATWTIWTSSITRGKWQAVWTAACVHVFSWCGSHIWCCSHWSCCIHTATLYTVTTSVVLSWYLL